MKIELEYAYSYLLSGNATVTLSNHESGKHMTFRVTQKKELGVRKPVWFVYYSGTYSYYIGYVRGDVFIPASEAYLQYDDKIRAFQYLWKAVITQQISPKMELLQSGACGRCGRELTDALSIKSGLGPECRKKLGIVIKQESNE